MNTLADLRAYHVARIDVANRVKAHAKTNNYPRTEAKAVASAERHRAAVAVIDRAIADIKRLGAHMERVS